jgi:thioredoxin-like negative regulator of GroEL
MSNELEAFLQQYRDLVLVNFWDEDCEASQYMARLLDSEPFHKLPVLRLTLAEHRAWAQAHGVYGTPALVAYYRGQPLLRISGRVTPEELRQRFQNLEHASILHPAQHPS